MDRNVIAEEASERILKASLDWAQTRKSQLEDLMKILAPEDKFESARDKTRALVEDAEKDITRLQGELAALHK